MTCTFVILFFDLKSLTGGPLLTQVRQINSLSFIFM